MKPNEIISKAMAMLNAKGIPKNTESSLPTYKMEPPPYKKEPPPYNNGDKWDRALSRLWRNGMV